MIQVVLDEYTSLITNQLRIGYCPLVIVGAKNS